MSEHLVDSTPSIIEVRNVLGLSSSPTHLLTDIGGATTNDCADPGGDIAAPIHLLEWAGYNHAATPAAPSGLSGNPGDVSSQANDPQQASYVYMSWSTVNCAVDYHVMAASGSGGSLIKIASTEEDEFYVDYLEDAEESRYYKIIAQALLDGSAPSAASAELHLRTTPTLPIPTGYTTNGNCDHPSTNLTISVTWTNGDAPGIRISEVEHRWKQIVPGGGTSYSAYVTNPLVSSASPTTFAIAQDVGTDHANGDIFDFDLRYKDYVTSPTTPVTFRVTLADDCFE